MTRNVDLTTAISFTRYDANSSKGMNRQQCNQNKKSFFFLIKCFDVEFLFGETGGILPFVVKSNKSISQSANIQDIRRIPTRLKIVTGTYRQIELFIPHILFLQLVIYVEMQTKP